MKTLLEFLENSKSSYHVIEQLAEMLEENDFCYANGVTDIGDGYGGFYSIIEGTTLIAVEIPEEKPDGFSVVASHSDIPCFRIKANPEMVAEDYYIKINTEKYGGMILNTWLDRPLSVAGRVTVATSGGVENRIIDIDEDLMVIPNLAIHMNRKCNDGVALNPQVDLLPLAGIEKGAFAAKVAKCAGVSKADIMGTDLYLYNRQKPVNMGMDREFVGSPGLDDRQCVYGTMKGFMESKPSDKVKILCVFDSEEVGSGTRQGADSGLLMQWLQTIAERKGVPMERMLRGSFLISADNAHGVHPNQPQKADPTNRPFLNKGIVIKYNSGGKYVTTGETAAVFKQICKHAQVPYQEYFNRSDVAGGSTLGQLAIRKIPMRGVDIGLAQLAMHSAFETAGALDTEYLAAAMKTFFETNIQETRNGLQIW